MVSIDTGTPQGEPEVEADTSGRADKAAPKDSDQPEPVAESAGGANASDEEEGESDEEEDESDEEEEHVPWHQRFPALLRLGLGGGRNRIPVVQQLTGTECGAACLSMVLSFFGKTVSLEELRHVSGVDRDGTNAKRILDAAAAKSAGLRCVTLGAPPDLEG